MHIINQDRDQVFEFDPNAILYTAPVIVDGVLYGINLMMDSKFLGTFDSAEAAIDEVSAIYKHKGEIYAVSGYSVGWED